MIRLEHTYFLWLLCFIPVALLILYFIGRWKKRAIKNFGNENLVNQLTPGVSKSRRIIKSILFLTGFTFLAIAICNPQMGSKMEEVKREGVELIIALDVSNSMKAEDLYPNRLENAKQAISRLIDNLHDDKIGIIVFGGEAYVQLPVTTDYSAAKLFLNTIDTDIIPTQGTNIGSAIELALTSFDKKNDKSKALVIITDGENHEEGALKLAEEATEKNITIHTIGMGSEAGGPIPTYSNGVKTGFKKDRDGNTVVTRLNEEMLREVAAAGKGAYIRATNGQTGLDAIFREINKMQKKQFGSKVYSDYDDKFQYFLAVALFLFLLDFFITGHKSRWADKINLFGRKEDEVR
jgi:Ca-activated chloride channel family protein